jgi:hypothetical protein
MHPEPLARHVHAAARAAAAAPSDAPRHWLLLLPLLLLPLLLLMSC